MSNEQSSVSIGLIREVFSSEFTPQLFAGVKTHEPALRLVAQLVRHTEDDDLLQAIVTAALPETYAGDTLKELPEMIAGARRKGFDKAATDLAEFEMTEAGLILFKSNSREHRRRQRKRLIRNPGLGARHQERRLGSFSAVARRRRSPA